MRKLKVGVIVDMDLTAITGGKYSYHHTMLNGINNYTFDESIEIVNVVLYKKTRPTVQLKKETVFIKGYLYNGLYNGPKTLIAGAVSKRIKDFSKLLGIGKKMFAFFDKINFRKIERALAGHNIDIIYHLEHQYADLNYPFITTHWDVGHKSTYPFPELALDGNHEARENYYTNIINKALIILCESVAGIDELKYYYSLNPAKIKQLPLFGNGNLTNELDEAQTEMILKAYQLNKNEFFLYPAQFWPLKNHYNLVLAFAELIKAPKNEHLKLLLTGSDKGSFDYIKKLINNLSLNGSVILAGFVSDQELSAFYINAIALVMPTYLGPTNMPLIEAAQLKCPVLCSNLPGHHEIMGDCAVYFDPENAIDIQNAMDEIANNTEKRAELIANAYEHIGASKFNLNNSLSILNNVLVQIKPIRLTWDVV